MGDNFEWKMKRSPMNSRFKGQYTKGYVEWEVANAAKTQAKVEQLGRAIEARAKAKLGEHRDTGASQIEYHKGDIDAFVVLVDHDPRGDNAAERIEQETGALIGAAKLPKRMRGIK
jgi:hypothetical protein